MVERDIASRGVVDELVLRSMCTVPRERFLPERMAEFAYEDTPLPIEEGQTISQPMIVAVMAEAAELDERSRVLEIGAGSGYGAAVLSRIVAEVWTIERHALLVDQAARRLADLGYDNAHVVHGDGTLGLPEQAPFDAIVVTAGGPSVPEALVEQLVEGGRLVIPVGPETRGQRLLRVRRVGDDTVEEDLGPVRFVPLVGEQGWQPSEVRTLVVPRHRSVPSGPATLVREVVQPTTSTPSDGSASTVSTSTASAHPGLQSSTTSTGWIPRRRRWPGTATAASPRGNTIRPPTAGRWSREASPAARTRWSPF